MARVRLTSRTSPLYILYILVLVGLFLASIVVEKGAVVLFVNGHHSELLDFFFKTITNLGDGLIVILIIGITLFVRFQYSFVAGLAWISNGLLVSLFKRILFYGLERPHEYLRNYPLHFVPGVEVHSINSFPSGHAATAFCAALFIFLVSRNTLAGSVALLLALLVGWSRLYLLQHFLMDVAGGAIIGCFSASIAWYVFDVVRKPAWMSRKIAIPLKNRNQPTEFN
jgi:membrane-associated phospholipid phosphatase